MIEPIYIAASKSLEHPQQMQFNLLDNVSWEAKASVAVVVRGWYKLVEWSRATADGKRRVFPGMAATYDRRWEELFGLAFDNKLSGHSIAKIATGARRRAITSKPLLPSRDTYASVPLALFPVGGHTLSPPRPSASASGNNREFKAGKPLSAISSKTS